MPAALKVRWGAGDWSHQLCVEGQVTQVFPPFGATGPCVEVDMTGVPVPPAKEEVAALDGQELDEYETDLIRRLRRGLMRAEAEVAWEEGHPG